MNMQSKQIWRLNSMNFVALIGIVDQVSNLPKLTNAVVKLKVEKSYITGDDDWYEFVEVSLDKDLFKTELNEISASVIIGVKGHMSTVENKLCLVCERVQVF
jgi:hypothetical protein